MVKSFGVCSKHTSVYIHMRGCVQWLFIYVCKRVCANDCVSVSVSMCVNICTPLV